MKKMLVCSVLFSAVAILIVLPVIRSVHIPAGNPTLTSPVRISDGDPMPNPTGPHKPNAAVLVADGDPMPNPTGPHKPKTA